MYEFEKKELRKEFKETEYGKKTNKMLYTSIIVGLVIFGVVSFVLGFLDGLDLCETLFIRELLSNILSPLFFVIAVVVCYFDGKRDGAITQYKKSRKENK